MIKRDKIVFLLILTIFGTRIRTVLWMMNKIKKLVTKKPTTQAMKFSIKDFFSKFNQIHKKCGFYRIY